MKLEPSYELNLYNLYQSDINSNNIINNLTISFELNNENLSYLIILLRQKYLINKIDNTIILTNLSNKQSQIIKNKDYFKIGMQDYMVYNECQLIIPMINKRIFDNNYGTTYNLYTPKIIL